MATTQYSGQETAGTRVDAVLAAAIGGGLDRALYDPTDLRFVAKMVPYAPGSDTNTGSRGPAPVAFASASSETSGGGSSTTYQGTAFTLAPTRRYQFYKPTDFVALTDPQPPGSEQNIVDGIIRNLADGVSLTVTDAIAALFTSVSTTVGDSVQALRADHIYDGIYAANLALMRADAQNPLICVLKQVQMNHLVESLRGETGTMAWQQATADMLRAWGPGIKGMWNNILFMQCDSCPLSDTSTNANGALFMPDAFGFQLMPVAPAIRGINPGDVIIESELFFLERGRDADNAASTYYGNIWLAAAILGENARAVRIRSSAS